MDIVDDTTDVSSNVFVSRSEKPGKARGMKRKAKVPVQKEGKPAAPGKAGPKKKGKANKRRGNEDDKLSVIYLGHIPHGFYEEEMQAFFTQFGEVQKVKLVRSKKTGKSRGFAFIKFRYAEVARVVADTMNNYLLRDKLLKCHVVPPTKAFGNLFSDATAGVKAKEKALEKHDETKLPDDVDIRRVRTWNRLVAKKTELGKIGIDLKELDVLDTTEKSSSDVFDTDKEREVEIMEEEEEAGVNQTAEKFKKKSSKRAAKEQQEEEEEEAVRFALNTMPGCKKLMEQLGKLSTDKFVVKEDEVEEGEKDDEEAVSFDEDEYSGSDVTEDEGGEDISDDDDGDEADSDENAEDDSDSEIEFKTPPGMKKRKMKSGADFVAVDSDGEEQSDEEGDDEGFEDKQQKKTPVKGTPKNKNTPKQGKKTPAKTPAKSPRYHDAVASSSKKTKKQQKLEKTPIQIVSSGKKKQKKVNSETKRETERRLQQQRRRSAPAGTALAGKKLKTGAFLDRSLGRPKSKRADEMDSD